MPLKVNLAHHPLDAFGEVLDLGHVLPQDPAGYVLRGGRAAASQELHEHQGLLRVDHAHALGVVVAQALVGGEGGGTCSLSIPLPLAMTIQVCWPRGQLGTCRAAS